MSIVRVSEILLTIQRRSAYHLVEFVHLAKHRKFSNIFLYESEKEALLKELTSLVCNINVCGRGR